MFTLRRMVATNIKPLAVRRSLTAITLATGDPCAEYGAAAVCRSSNETWRVCERRSHVLSLSEMHAAWQACAQHPASGWRDATGPIDIARLEVRRVGWDWSSPFVVMDDRGSEIHLANVSPKDFQLAVYEGMHRSLARRIAAQRPCTDNDGGCRLAYESF